MRLWGVIAKLEARIGVPTEALSLPVWSPNPEWDIRSSAYRRYLRRFEESFE